MYRGTVAILGGYGVFGSRIARSLARHPELELIIAGRDGAATLAFAARSRRACDVDASASKVILAYITPSRPRPSALRLGV